MALKPDTDIFSSAKAVRDKLSQEQAKEIQELYKQWAEDIGKQAKKLEESREVLSSSLSTSPS